MTDPGLSFPDQPRSELDRRLADLVQAANEVLATQGRLHSLLRANWAITAQLDIDSVLKSTVEAARELTGARYAALAVFGENGELSQFVHAGMSESQIAAIGRLPRGEGLLGVLIREQHPIRIVDIAADPRSTGVPEGHPPMRDFLGVPIRVRGVVYGDLYLANYPDGHFTDEDQELLRSLAGTAGIAIENARLYSLMELRRGWAAATGEITARLLSPENLLGSENDDALALLAERVRAVTEASGVFVLLVSPDGEHVSIVAVDGEDPQRMLDQEVLLEGSFTEVVLQSARAQRWDEQEAHAMGFVRAEPFGPVLALPLVTPDRRLGAILVARARGAAPFTEPELGAASDFAGRVSIAFELSRSRRDAERLMLFEDRGRIARDLHDRVIQQLFATGMQLQGVLGTMPMGTGADRVDAAVAALDDSIAQIRRIIFTLESTGGPVDRATGRHRLFDLVAELGSAFSIEPELTVTGPVDAVVDGDLADDLLAVVAEGVTNAVKHAAAQTVSVHVAVDEHGVAARVANDGLPLERSEHTRGLDDLEQRALRRGGGMTLETEVGLTVLEWAVPLRSSARTSR